jgi:hypothetical protein
VIQEGERGMESASSERWTRTRTELLAFLRIACAGMAAEELWFGESTTGPGGDLVGATEIAAQMVGALGMTDSLISYVAMEEGLNDRNVVARYSPAPRQGADRAAAPGRQGGGEGAARPPRRHGHCRACSRPDPPSGRGVDGPVARGSGRG